ncbi:hypothetical protein BOTBODRAFT_177426 [Botryobasidium botryosum FD-172 SS1]|uniref:Uncharacterized protein n=1 Tax=Botryobasidium botryosum (strain FD-172 SS1) TaxID=930990 RepID=A0A067M6L4_BOTB1|nr:hypothetical protein BOTBODRAFT_177426 [Botryobasidium botryosum FD-172 SS1]
MPPRVCPDCGKEVVNLNRHINDVHTQTKQFPCNFVGCKHISTQRCNLQGHQIRNGHLSSETGGTIAPLSSGTFSPRSAVTPWPNPIYSGPSDRTVRVDYPYGGAAFAPPNVDVGHSPRSHLLGNVVATPLLAPQPIPRLLVENSNLPGPCLATTTGEGFTNLGPGPPQPLHILQFLSDDNRVYAPDTQHACFTGHCGPPIAVGEMAIPITNDGFQLANPHLTIGTAWTQRTEAGLYGLFGNVEDNSAAHNEGVWYGGES